MLSFAIKLILIIVIEIKEKGLSQGKKNTFKELSWGPPSWKIFSRSAGFLTIVGYILRVTPIIMYQGWYLTPTLTPPLTSNPALYKYINYVQHNCFNSWFFISVGSMFSNIEPKSKYFSSNIYLYVNIHLYFKQYILIMIVLTSK
jgi:hypothetical protein